MESEKTKYQVKGEKSDDKPKQKSDSKRTKKTSEAEPAKKTYLRDVRLLDCATYETAASRIIDTLASYKNDSLSAVKDTVVHWFERELKEGLEIRELRLKPETEATEKTSILHNFINEFENKDSSEVKPGKLDYAVWFTWRMVEALAYQNFGQKKGSYHYLPILYGVVDNLVKL